MLFYGSNLRCSTAKIALVLICATGTASMYAETHQINKSGQTIATKPVEAASMVSHATVEETFKAVQDPHVAFVDVREPDEVAVVAAKGSRSIPMSTINPETFEATSGIKKSQHLYLICRSGARSLRVGTALAGQGYQHVHNVEGGTVAWEQAALPTTHGK